MDIAPYVREVLGRVPGDPLPLTSEEARTFAILAANRYSRDTQVEYGSEAWGTAYVAALDALEVMNRLNSEWEG